MKSGDTFQLVGVADQHLWVVISDPQRFPEVVLFVNFTSLDKYADQTVILDPGVHSFVKHRTCVNYPRARVATLDQLKELEQANRLRKTSPVTPELLAKIRDGASRSIRLRTEHLQILADQELIEL